MCEKAVTQPWKTTVISLLKWLLSPLPTSSAVWPPTKLIWLKTTACSLYGSAVSAGATVRISRDRNWQLVIRLLKQDSPSSPSKTSSVFLPFKRSNTDSFRLQTASLFCDSCYAYSQHSLDFLAINNTITGNQMWTLSNVTAQAHIRNFFFFF